MKVKIIYFLRHGESELNAQGIRQGAEGCLSEKGRVQSEKVAVALAKEKKFDALISSPIERAKETAEIIAKTLEMPIEELDLLVERKNPSEIVGKHKDSPEVLAIVDRIDNSFHDDDLRYSDEENFTDLKERAKKLLKYISGRKEKRLLMVTHGIFLKLFTSYMVYGDRLKAHDYASISYKSEMDNAGVTICSYTTYWFKKPEWKLLLWNGVLAE